jgi:processive 1,2-diacylglycerol beta-glucosyltransferase
VPDLFNKESGALIGKITAEQLRDLIDLLVEESADDRDYYIDRNTLDYLADNNADPELLQLLRAHVPEDGEGIDIEWRD